MVIILNMKYESGGSRRRYYRYLITLLVT